MVPSVIDVPPSASPHVARAITTARQLIAGATSANTRRGYETGWRQFTAHAKSLGLEPLGAHPALVATFLGHLRDGRGVGPDPKLAGGGDPVLSSAAVLASPTDQRVVRDLLRAPGAKTPAATTAAPRLPPNGSPRRSRSRGRRRRRSPSATARSFC
jgi:hypothetical protein